MLIEYLRVHQSRPNWRELFKGFRVGKLSAAPLWVLKHILVSMSVDDFTAGNIMPSTQTLLATSPGPLTRMFDHLDFTDAVNGQMICTIVNCLLREASTIRRQLALNATPVICARLATLKNTCSYIGLALPTSYSHPVRNVSLG